MTCSLQPQMLTVYLSFWYFSFWPATALEMLLLFICLTAQQDNLLGINLFPVEYYECDNLSSVLHTLHG